MTDSRRPIPRALIILLAVAAGGIVTLTLRQVGWLVAPVMLALVLVILFQPVHAWLRRKRVPEILSLIAFVLVVFGVLIAVVAIIALSLTRLAAILPGYAANADQLFARTAERLSGLGFGRDEIRSTLGNFDLRRLSGPLATLVSRLSSLIATSVFLFSLLIFLSVEATSAGPRLVELARLKPRTAAALHGFARNTRRFLAVTAIFGLITGTANTLLLVWLDIPLALLWGLLAAVCNFIPYVGFVIGLVPPALLALLGGDWRLMIFVVIAYVLLNSLFTSLIQPYFIGDAVGVSVTVTLISLVFWGWVLGPLGAILAIPLTLLAKAVLVDPDPNAAWAEALIGSTRRHRKDVAPPTTGSEPDPAAP
ncbi:AI-2E family transporter [Microlunatus ginsengisoli]|uniref:AI-2E family transporter n=1 Tax=Microlunatus ginsengisoli TaxID=363863 RepID=A0ABP6ZZ26_9ACTN